MKQVIFTSVAVLGLLLVTSTSSRAAGPVFNGSYSGYGQYGGYGQRLYGGNGYGGYGGYTSIYQTYPCAPRWRNPGHLHWHPGGWQQHYNHFDYVPGHYDYHQTGHWGY